MIAGDPARPDRQHAARGFERLSPPGVHDLRKLESAEPTGSIKDRVALAMVDAAELEPGSRPARADEREHRHLARARGEAARLKLTCVMPANATPERRLVLELFGARSSIRRRMRARTAPYGSRRRWPRPIRATRCCSSTRTNGTRGPLRGHRRRDRARPASRGRARRRARHRRDADGDGRAAARGLPGHRRRRRGAAAGRSRDGAAFARGRLCAADPRRVEARPEDARLERRVGRRRACAARPRGHLRGRFRRRGRPRGAEDRGGAAEGSVVVAVLADGGWKYLSRRLLGCRERGGVDGDELWW